MLQIGGISSFCLDAIQPETLHIGLHLPQTRWGHIKGNHLALITHQLCDVGGLPPWSGTGIEHPQARGELKQRPDALGAAVLHAPVAISKTGQLRQWAWPAAEADALRQAGIAVFGPGAEGAQLEASKAWAKQLMQEAGVPTAGHWAVTSEVDALAVLAEVGRPLVVKADGLAAGKGVTVADTIEQAEAAIRDAFAGRFGSAGSHLVLEERLQGPEVSVFALCDGERMVLLPPAQDHKRLLEGDRGPNTGGMGAYAPAPLLDAEGLEQVRRLVLEPTLQALKARGIDYRGVIYAGLMLTDAGPQVIEFNCRFGDPECQTLMPLLGPELAQVLQACALGRLDLAPALSIDSRCSACVVAAASGYPDAPRKGDAIQLGFSSETNRQLFHAGTRRDANGELITAGGRVLAVVAQGDSFDQAFAAAYNGLQQVQFDGITYRRDIGHQVRSSG